MQINIDSQDKQLLIDALRCYARWCSNHDLVAAECASLELADDLEDEQDD